MKAIFILLDSLNRNYLPIYGNDWVQTPNIQRLAQQGIVFDNHWLGSAPCMPARRDILTGRLNFLERGWGPIEPFDIPFTRLLRKAGIRSHMETDHYHYFHVGGENYHTQFDTYAFHRGQEEDPWRSSATLPVEPEHLGRWTAQYDLNREAFRTAAEYPTPKTFNGAIDWLEDNEDADDYVLWVEGFDPHEPFDCPREYLDRYGDDWPGPRYDWTSYLKVEESEEATTHLRRQYAGTVSMADEYLGKLLDELDRQAILDDALIILTTDHGHLIGEHGATGKNRWHVWNELGNLPLVIKLPGNRHAGERRGQLTQNIDVMPTLLDYFDVDIDHAIHGESLKAVFQHFLIPTTYSFHDVPGSIFFKDPEIGQFLPYTDLPVLRSPWQMKRWNNVKDTMLFNIEADPGQQHNLAGTEAEKKYIELLRQTMQKMDAPAEQYDRLGL